MERLSVTGVLRVRVRRATDLPAGDVIGSSDPYVVVEVGSLGPDLAFTASETHRTRRKANTHNPRWDTSERDEAKALFDA